MNCRIAQYNLKELILDHEAVARSLNEGCRRDDRYYRVSGLCQTRENVIFMLEEDPDGHAWEYVIVPFLGETEADIIADIYSRWQGNFSTRGLIQLANKYLGLFEKPHVQSE